MTVEKKTASRVDPTVAPSEVSDDGYLPRATDHTTHVVLTK